MTLLAVSSDTKTVKGERLGYLTGILYMAPGKLSGRNLCPFASAGCLDACLNTAGRGVMTSVQRGRMRKALVWLNDRPTFWADLRRDVAALVRKAEREGLIPVVRPNGTSDVQFERYPEWRRIRDDFPTVIWYDYTKAPVDCRPTPEGYHLTQSATENTTIPEMALSLVRGRNVAVVLFPRAHAAAVKRGSWAGMPAVDGDTSDLRFDDPAGHLVLLKAKGKARHDKSGFVRGDLVC